MKTIIALLILLVVTSLVPTYFINRNLKDHQKQLDLHEQRLKFNNAVRYHDTTYFVYGLQGTGYVKKKYPVYSPVYMSEMDMLNAANDHWKEQIQKLDDEGAI